NAGLKAGDLVSAVGPKTVDRYQELVEEIRTHKAGDKVQLKVRRGEEDKQIEVTLADRPAQVAATTRPSGGIYGGQIENVQDEQGPNGYEYGGIYKSTDGGESWARINSLNPRPMYFSLIRVDPSDAK